MLYSCCPNLLVDAQSDAPIDIPDLEATGPTSSEVQQFDKSVHRDMSERYVTASSLDRGSSEQHINCETWDDLYLADFFMERETIVNLYLANFFTENEDEIPPGEMPSNETILDVEHGKDEGILMMVSVPHIAFSMKFDNTCKDYSTIVVVNFKVIPEKSSCRTNTTFIDQLLSTQFPFNPGIHFKSKYQMGYTVNMETLPLMGSTCMFFFFVYANPMTHVWDSIGHSLHHHYCARYFTRPTTDFNAPHLGLVLNVAGQFHREGTAQVLQIVIAGKTGVNPRAQVTFEMHVVFDPGGGPLDVPILEARDGVFEATLNAIATLFIYNAPLSVDTLDLQDWKTSSS
ncbi:uncharacterized protein LOC107806402 isoform X1 [Nicotiana tabacum]|uniref:Uncharacterized protein LOC107806402 isoform X1 n=1 Tax=Nicotiana tabacum TaxID=4097 RepID=A0A1S4BB46_TOBAC